MQTERGKAFVEYEPDLSEEEIDAAHDGGKIVLSFKAKPRLSVNGDLVAYVAVKMVFCDGSEPMTVLFDRLSAETMSHWVQTMKSMDWKTDSMKPGPARY
jgi:hypothetical protein